MKDIQERADLEKLLWKFYETAIADEEIGHHFIDLNLDKHIPVITDFWEKVLFGRPVYFNSPLVPHIDLHEKSPLLPDHFARWIEIFYATLDEFFAGEVVEDAKMRAAFVARNMSNRLNGAFMHA
ncbi:MAG: group III truncated hemoglobin [Acidobacteria bacterium]|nr:group III truncated hemoglobin [Acidobacteriota bacterium]